MLTDTERKILIVIRNIFRIKGRFPSAIELQYRTGRSMEKILNALESLQQKGYIRWDADKKSIEMADPISQNIL
ncbi:hypothetical protein [Thermicanus aegyptius]|uniref:LexA family protein n=1 Tax=Thermicanus aegyptius TaxID=94009 RepID=UPI00040468B8|nr:hypothetical protein [Thermicanus aegyptius]